MVKTLNQICIDWLCLAVEHSNLALLKSSVFPPLLRQEILQRLIDHDMITTKFLPQITYCLITCNLNCLDVYGSSLISDDFLTHIARSDCQLSYVRLKKCNKITDSGLCELLVNQKTLEVLKLQSLSINGKCLLRIHSSKLKVLSLSRCNQIQLQNLVQCVHSNSHLEHLNVKGFRTLDSATIKKIAPFLSNLQVLNLTECVLIGDLALEEIAGHCPQLRVLKLMECAAVTQAAFQTIAQRCHFLEVFDISFCTRSITLSVDVFAGLPISLTSLKLYGIATSCNDNEFSDAMDRLINLKELSLNGFGILTDALLATLLPRIGSRLVAFDLSGSFKVVTDSSLEQITYHCSRLETLGLSMLFSITGLPLLHYFEDSDRASLLKSLRIACCPMFKCEVLQSICRNCVNLEMLEASNCRDLTDEMLNVLTENTNGLLRVALFKSCSGLTDESLCRFVCKCPNLENLCLSGVTSITDKTILMVANHCYYLTEIYLSGCGVVSDAVVQYLKDQVIGRLLCYRLLPANESETVLVAKDLDLDKYVRLIVSDNSSLGFL